MALLFLVILLAGCAALPVRAPALATCEQAYSASDYRIERAGMQDAGAARIAGFPYLRATRFLASFGDVELAPVQKRAWLNTMRSIDLQARRIELENLYSDSSRVQRELRTLADCGRLLMAADLQAPGRVSALQERRLVPDLYNDTARALGAYPLAVAFMKLGVARWRAQTLRRFAVQEPVAASSEKKIEYMPSNAADGPGAPQIAQWIRAASAASPLSIPLLPPDQLERVAAVFAPVLQVPGQHAYDLIGTPKRNPQGLEVDTTQPEVYWEYGFARFDGQVLLQISYTLFFPRRPASYLLDPFAGAVDGLVWRVTLDRDGEPLIYDSIHPCGCYHLFFPTKRLQLTKKPGFWQEAITVPLFVPENAGIELGISSGDHFIQSVTASGASEQKIAYELRGYDTLRMRRPQRLFDEQGFMPGTERGERWFLWPSGVPNAGAMRQSGRQVTAFIGKRYFDEPGLIGRYFQRR